MLLATHVARRAQYEGAKALAHARLRRRSRGRQPVLVHQMGKVASQSISRALSEHGVYNFQTHYLSPPSMAAAERVYRRAWEPGRRGAQHLWQSQVIRSSIGKADRRWKVITVVRDPVARNVSSFFQTADLEHGLDLASIGPATPPARFRRLFLEQFTGHHTPLTWLDDEIRAVFGVDALGTPFPQERGYVLCAGESADVLVLRYDDLPRVFSEAVSNFLGHPVSLDVRHNSSETKGYGAAYAAALSQLSLPADYLNTMYESRYARHFWTPDERVRMRSRWEIAPKSASPGLDEIG